MNSIRGGDARGTVKSDDATADDGPCCARPCVLVVEDDALLARCLGRIIRCCGKEAILVGSVRAATAQVAVLGSLNAVILDVSLPDGSGLDVLRWLRREGLHLPALVFTGLVDHDVANAAFDLDAKYLRKPADVAHVEAFLRGVGRKSNQPCNGASAVSGAVDAWNKRYVLSEAEGDILHRGAEGHSRDDIAAARRCSELTIQKHVSNLLQKTGDDSFHEAIGRLLRDALRDGGSTTR